VATELSAIEIADGKLMTETPAALQRLDEVTARLRGRRPAVFLDFDGTLAPIVDRPEQAVMDSQMRAAVERVARLCPVAVVSGRDLPDVRRRVGLDDIYYAGSHGFDIGGPRGTHLEHRRGIEALPALEGAERMLREAAQKIDGALIDRKHFSIAVHYRLVRPADAAAVEAAVDGALAQFGGLRKGHGKKVFELQPDIDWNKGAAVRWLLQALSLDGPDVLPIYFGDDVTDEDAFLALADDGLCFAVLDASRPTAAHFGLADPGEVRMLLHKLADAMQTRR
jgi:alpha,alpha-trehalase